MLHPISIRINILTNVLIIVGLIAASLLGLQYYFSQQLAMSAAHKSFTQSVQKITQHMQTVDITKKNILYLSELYPDLLLSPGEIKNPVDTIKRFSINMQHSPNIYAMYVGHLNGDLFEVVNMKISANLYDHFKAPKNTRWTLIQIFNSSNGRIRQFDYYDPHFKLISSRSETSNYQANTRPWFIQASKSNKATRTDPYLFKNLQQKGITFAKTIHNSNAVIAIDFTLKKLNDTLFQEKIDPSSELLLFGKEGNIVASSESQSSNTNIDTFLTLALEKNQTERIIRYKSENEDKFMMISLLSKELSAETYLGITIDADIMLAPYMEVIKYSFFVASVFLLFAIPFILYMISRIVKPIKLLMAQSNKIKDRKFDEVVPIHSNIIELTKLSNLLISMSKSIQAYQRSQQELMDSFIRLIVNAIDEKSSYTGGHCQRVPIIAMMLAKKVTETNDGVFKDFKLNSEDEWREFELGALLHDCGKVTTPEYVVDKATKLETIHNRIHEIRTRFEVIWRDHEITYYQGLINNEDAEQLLARKEKAQQKLQEDFSFIAQTNIGGEFMSTDKKERIHSISTQTWVRHFNDRAGLSDIELLRYAGIEEQTLPTVETLLSDRPEHCIERVNFDEEAYRQQGFKLDVPDHLYNYGEVYNLCIEKGTLSTEERFKINEHVIMTIKMLEMLPFPDNMKHIPEFAGTHHETMNSTGYPRKLNKEGLSIPARIMAIADIFEALTASDRPYKKGKTLSQAIKIMGYMKKDHHIDEDLFELFLLSEVYQEYALNYLKPEQIDEFDIKAYLG